MLWEGRLAGAEEEAMPKLEIHRLKGRLVLKNGSHKMVQGVREIFEIFDAPPHIASDAATAPGKIVLIGRELQAIDFQKSMNMWLIE
jgi:hypothetical protein